MLCQYYIVMLIQPTTRYVMLKLMGQEGVYNKQLHGIVFEGCTCKIILVHA